MLASPHHLVVVTLLTGAWLARTTLAQVTCDSREIIDKKQCAQAISQIVYDQPKNILDRVSTIFMKRSGNCTILVYHPDEALVTKKQIEAGFVSIFDKCQSREGTVALSDMANLQVNYYQSYRADYYFPPQNLTCGLNTNAPSTVEKDCQDVFESYLADGEGRLINDDHHPSNYMTKSFKTCTIIFYTTDESPLIAKKSELKPVITKMLKGCRGKSGVMAMKKGGSGNNGLTVVKVQSSKPCESPANTDGQKCR
ncbi:hypothetical protein Pst134EA_030292 [Puccinia striiformis f. sp. tritici]|uniref:hypothetical protein n=1 Tax=Puccinia striiformis f. sp. tritici TaxID=168172 RepID=UPI002008AC86|nr:hypothetical protein Pst134EA_030292 [Puccinia striiformis f. sp. tritici]KAH9446371.1 hypothetical protein Pst134EA_030292 [Puccinia striiformis f. sp. tritici]